MALSKTSDGTTGHDVIQLISPEAAEDIQMSISADGMAHILARLTDLYANPIEAAVREVISNAIDASVLLPEDQRQPIEVSLPSALRTAFVVRDFGVGMTSDTVRKIYSQYGASTKRSDMKQIGAYGLGAKAPLAYCTAFSVSTTRDGVTTTFSISRESGGNYVKITGEERTGLPAGTIVTIPVKAGDEASFNSALDSYRKFSFDVPVKIDGEFAEANDFVLLEEAFVLDQESGTTGRVWVSQSSIADLLTGKFARYGNEFPFSYVLSGWSYKSPTRNRYGYARESKLVVELQVGVVDFSSSRDEITNNERSAALDSRIAAYIASKSKEDIDRVLDVYRALPREQAMAVFRSVISMGTVEGSNLVFNKGTFDDPISFTSEEFTTVEGYSPLKLLTDDYDKNVHTAFVLNREARNLSVYNSRLIADPDLLNLKSVIFSAENVSKANAEVLEAFNANAPTVSLASLLFNLDLQGKTYSNDKLKQVIIVTESSADSLKRLLANRRIFSETDFTNTLFIIGNDNKSVRAQAKLLSSESNYEIEFHTASSLLDRGKALRKARRAATPRYTEPMSVRLLTEGDLTEEVDVLSALNGRSFGFERIMPKDLMEENALLILTKSNARAALIGAANSGVKITERKIYVAENNKGILAPHFKELSGYEEVIVSQDYTPKSVAAEKLAANRVYSGRLLKSQLRAASTEDIVRSVIVPLYVNKKFYGDVLNFITVHYPEDKALIKLLKSAAVTERYGKGVTFGSLTDDEIRGGLPKKDGIAVIALRDSIRAVGNRNTLTGVLLHAIMEFSGDVKSHITDELFEEFYATYVDKVSEATK